MKDSIIEAVSSFKTYLEDRYEIKAELEDYNISDKKVYVGNKLIGFTNYNEAKNRFIGFQPVREIRLKPRQSFTIGDFIKKNGVFKRIQRH